MRPTLRETERASKVTKEETDEVKGPGGDISKMKLAGKAVYSNIKLFAFQAIATEGKLTGNWQHGAEIWERIFWYFKCTSVASKHLSGLPQWLARISGGWYLGRKTFWSKQVQTNAMLLEHNNRSDLKAWCPWQPMSCPGACPRGLCIFLLHMRDSSGFPWGYRYQRRMMSSICNQGIRDYFQGELSLAS